jgi:hypothetical protein
MHAIGGHSCEDSNMSACTESLPIIRSVPGDRGLSHLELCDIGEMAF